MVTARIWKNCEVVVGRGMEAKRVQLNTGDEVEVIINHTLSGVANVRLQDGTQVNIQNRNLTDKAWNGQYFR